MGAEWISLAPTGATFDISRDLIATADRNGFFLSLNAAWERCLGWTRDELIGHPFVEFVHPDDLDRTSEESAKGGTPDYELANFDNRYRTRDGGWRWLRWSARTDGTMWLAVAIDITEDREAEQRLREALTHQGLLLYAQPIVEPRSRQLVQRELLVRMYGPAESGAAAHPDILLPAAFLPAAEHLGLVTQIDRWVTSRALALAQRGRSVEVNLSAQTVSDEDFASELLGLLRYAPEAAANLVFEITETAAIENLDAAQRLGTALTELGSGLALDDFGTGFGSFYYLKHLPADYLKIDGDFVRSPRSRTDELIVEAIVQVARGLGKRTIAEFVTDEETVTRMRELGVDYAQGYHVGRPFPVAELPARLGGAVAAKV
jgi:PAS domain S-box-containing protein